MSASLNAQGVTVVLTTHYLEEAEQLCDRIAIINHGRLIANEPTRELVAKAQEKAVVVDGRPRHRRPCPTPLLREDRADRRADARDHLPQGQGECRPGARRACSATGSAIVDVSTREPDLEDVFLSLTREDGGMSASLRRPRRRLRRGRADRGAQPRRRRSRSR